MKPFLISIFLSFNTHASETISLRFGQVTHVSNIPVCCYKPVQTNWEESMKKYHRFCEGENSSKVILGKGQKIKINDSSVSCSKQTDSKVFQSYVGVRHMDCGDHVQFSTMRDLKSFSEQALESALSKCRMEGRTCYPESKGLKSKPLSVRECSGHAQVIGFK